MRRILPFVIVATLLLLVFLAGCDWKAEEDAKKTRSSYISARAVLVGVQEFPGRMEELIRSQDPANLGTKAQDLVASTRGLAYSASSAFQTCRNNAEQLKKDGDEQFTAYADRILELIGLNEQVIDAYSEFMSLSNSLASNMPYDQDPSRLMPSLDYLDNRTKLIQQLMDQMKQLEAQADQLYQGLMKEA